MLSIVIPALNEEGAIASIVARCLAARPALAEAGVGEVELLVVSDGSSDRTEALALANPEVTVLAFDRNRGYGAAIQAGFAQARGDALAFIDADGTCDPREFCKLWRALEDQSADIALGSRMGRGNEMPALRRVGNTLFAWLLGVLSKRRVYDTASGMRILRRSAYEQLLPLPHGMNFTPAMSARALLEGRLKLVEVPMSYAERIGRSKLSVLSDGLRFLRSILHAVLVYRPSRLLLVAAGLLSVAMVAVGAAPVRVHLAGEHLPDWMIYRAMLASLLGALGGMAVCAAVVSERIAAAAHGRGFATVGITALAAGLFGPRARLVVWALLACPAIALVAPGFAELLATGEVTLHWARPLLASLVVLLFATHLIAVVLLGMIDLIERQARAAEPTRAPDRVRAGRAS